MSNVVKLKAAPAEPPSSARSTIAKAAAGKGTNP